MADGSLFGGTAQPRWMGTDERMALYQRLGQEQAEPFSRAFQQSLAQTRSQGFQKEMVKDERAYQKQLLQEQLDAMRKVWQGGNENARPAWMDSEAGMNYGGEFDQPGVNQIAAGEKPLSQIKDFQEFNEWVQAHPTAIMDPRTRGMVETMGQNFADAERIKSNAERTKALSLAGKMALADTDAFVTRMNKITNPKLRSKVRAGFKFNADQTPTKESWEALEVAEQEAESLKEAEAQKRIAAAVAGGARETLRIDESGNISRSWAPPAQSTSSTASTLYQRKMADLTVEKIKAKEVELDEHTKKKPTPDWGPWKANDAAELAEWQKKQDALQGEYNALMQKLETYGTPGTSAPGTVDVADPLGLFK